MSGATNQPQAYETGEWIHDWDYKRILPEYSKPAESVTLDVDMDVEPTYPLPEPNENESHHDQEMAIFWARVPKYLGDDASDISDDEFRTLDEDNQAAFAPSLGQRRNSTNDLSAFNKSPPLSWDQQHNADDPMKGDADSVMSPLQHDHGLLTQNEEDERMDDADGATPGALKGAYSQKFLKEVVTQAARKDYPLQPTLGSSHGHHKQLFQEMRHSYHERRPRQVLPTPPQEQQRLLQEMRERQQVNKTDPKTDISNQEQGGLRQQTPPPLPNSSNDGPCHSPSSSVHKDMCYSASQISSPISVSEMFSGDLSPEDYHARVRQLTEKNLFERQQNLLQESMRRTLESRKALRVESWPEEYERGDKLMKVLEQVDSTSQKISQTYHLEIGFGAA
eukprot:scaffold2164_cov106-Cylindrotheca_fusiformis.AAC.13